MPPSMPRQTCSGACYLAWYFPTLHNFGQKKEFANFSIIYYYYHLNTAQIMLYYDSIDVVIKAIRDSYTKDALVDVNINTIFLDILFILED